MREVVTASREGGASLNILSGLVAGNFSAYWLGMVIVVLMAIAYGVSTIGLGALMVAPAVFAFGLVAFGFLGMGPVTIAVDSYGPVTDNAQSIFELSLIEQIPGIKQRSSGTSASTSTSSAAKHLLEENDGAGNTFKATAKPVLIGTAVVGRHHHDLLHHRGPDPRAHPEPRQAVAPAPALPARPHHRRRRHLLVHGASTQAVRPAPTGRWSSSRPTSGWKGTKASVTDSKKVVEICTQYAQKGMFNIFLTVFFSTLAFAFLDPTSSSAT